MESASIECLVCKHTDLCNAPAGALLCGHVFCEPCLYKLWEVESRAAEARARSRLLEMRTRAQVQTISNDSSDNSGRNVRCPCCQQLSSIDDIRKVFLPSITSTSATNSPATADAMSRSTSQSSAMSTQEAFEDVTEQLAATLQALDIAHADAAQTALAHDQNIQQMQAQFMQYAEQAHQTQVQGLVETNALMGAELNRAAVEVNALREQLARSAEERERAVRQAAAERDQAVQLAEQQRALERQPPSLAQAQEAGVERLYEKLSTSGSIGAPLRSASTTSRKGSQTTFEVTAEWRGESISVGMKAVRHTASDVLSGTSSKRPARKAASAHSAKPSIKTESAGGKPQSTRSQVRTPIPSSPSSDESEDQEDKAYEKPAPRSIDQDSHPAHKAEQEASISMGSSSFSGADYRSPLVQSFMRKQAEDEGRRWPLDKNIIIPLCTAAMHKFNGLGSNGTHLQYRCKHCKWHCQERKPEGYIAQKGRTSANASSKISARTL